MSYRVMCPKDLERIKRSIASIEAKIDASILRTSARAAEKRRIEDAQRKYLTEKYNLLEFV